MKEESQTSDGNAGGFIRRNNSKEVEGNHYIRLDDKSLAQFQHTVTFLVECHFIV